MTSFERETFHLVYQAGHHDVYCNRRQHFKFFGDHFGTAPIAKLDTYPAKVMEISGTQCDCRKWAKKGQP